MATYEGFVTRNDHLFHSLIFSPIQQMVQESIVRSSSTFHIFDISSESSVPILTKLGMHDSYDKGFQSWGAGIIRGPARKGHKWVKLGQTSKNCQFDKIFSSQI